MYLIIGNIYFALSTVTLLYFINIIYFGKIKMYKKFVLFLILHELIFFIFYLTKRNFFPGNYVYLEFLNFYLILLIPLLVIFIILKNKRKREDLLNFFTSSLIGFLLNYAILMTFVVNGDRSPSMYILTSIKTSNGISFEETRDKMYNNFFIEKEQFKKRIDEQLHLKNVEKKNNNLYITNKGERVIKIFKFFNYFTNIENF